MCPTSGEVVSLVFPVFANTNHTFVDMVYCREHDAAIALLKSSEGMYVEYAVHILYIASTYLHLVWSTVLIYV